MFISVKFAVSENKHQSAQCLRPVMDALFRMNIALDKGRAVVAHIDRNLLLLCDCDFTYSSMTLSR